MKNNDPFRNEPFGVESLILWNTGLFLSFLLIISLGYIVPLFSNSVGIIYQTFSTQLD